MNLLKRILGMIIILPLVLLTWVPANVLVLIINTIFDGEGQGFHSPKQNFNWWHGVLSDRYKDIKGLLTFNTKDMDFWFIGLAAILLWGYLLLVNIK